jgi:hypothetical protein
MGSLGSMLSTEGNKPISNGEFSKFSKKWFFDHWAIFDAMEKMTDEELDKVKADCEAGKWSKKLPGKPLLWAFMSKTTRKTKYLQMFAVGVDVIKYQRTKVEELLKHFEQHEKNIRDLIEQEGKEKRNDERI